MLVYHSAFDANHALFRIASLIEMAPEKKLRSDMLRILDFLFVFPHYIKDVSLPNKMKKGKNRLSMLENKFNMVRSPRAFMRRIKPLQDAAVYSLAARGFLLKDNLSELVQRTDKPYPDKMIDLLSELSELDKYILNFLATEVSSVPLDGKNGLKQRTGLMEYRYDPV